MSNSLLFFVNGKEVVVKEPDPTWTLIFYLRTKLHLTGSKLACGEGGCGACTVMVSHYDRQQQEIRHHTVNACITPLCSLHGRAVTTVEGVGSVKDRVHPVQKRLVAAHGSQCGYCSPGMVMSMYTLLRNNANPSLEDIEQALGGNLCRCTGYRPILEGFRAFSKEGCGLGEQCCQNQKHEEQSSGTKVTTTPYDVSQEPIFPSKLKLDKTLFSSTMHFSSSKLTWFRPVTIEEALKLKHDHRDAEFAVGNTLRDIKELQDIQTTVDGVVVGGAVTLGRLRHHLQGVISEIPEEKSRIFRALVKTIDLFAGEQIRNVVGIAGSIMSGFRQSDLNPIHSAGAAAVTLLSSDGKQKSISLENAVFTGKNGIEKNDLFLSVKIPYSNKNEYLEVYRNASRKTLSIATMAAAFYVKLKNGDSVEKARIAFSGVENEKAVPENTAALLVNRAWDMKLLASVLQNLAKELDVSDVHKEKIVNSFFLRFYVSMCEGIICKVPADWSSAVQPALRAPSRGLQLYEEEPVSVAGPQGAGRSTPHRSGLQQATGEALYCDDIPVYKMSAGKLLNINTEKTLALPGVVDVITHKDTVVNEDRLIGEIFVSETMYSRAQAVCAVLAETKEVAQAAAKTVEVSYEPLDAIYTIKEAIAANSFHGDPQVLEVGDVSKILSESEHVLEGEVEMGGQEHFYMEPHVAVALTNDADELEVFSAVQGTAPMQALLAKVLGMPQNKIYVRTKRIGGGFGGKVVYQSALITVPVAIAARKHRRPVRCALDRDEDMSMTGGRHPFLIKYKAVWCALVRVDNAYNLPAVKATGHCCKTNLPSNTACRGFGGPQACFSIETAINHIAEYLNKPVHEVREINMYKEGDVTFFKDTLQNYTLDTCWRQLKDESDFLNRHKAVIEYNSKNRWTKRGISLVPVSVPAGFYVKFMSQGAALVILYLDGTVLVHHGGVEIGQGLHTKCIQIAARTLGVPLDQVHINETSSVTVPNAAPTGASTTTDIFGAAVMNACLELNDRLAPYKKVDPSGSFRQWVNAAYNDRVSLSATGFYKTPGVENFDIKNPNGKMATYWTVGAAVTEVELDCLTGDVTPHRVDIVMDVGTSINPAIDVGQIEGAYMQGYGLFIMEEVKHSSSGQVLTTGPNSYKIPTCKDIPVEMNVTLLKNSRNKHAVYSSKAVGEPPLYLGVGAYFAARLAVTAARADNGSPAGYFRLDSPATPKRLLAACETDVKKHVMTSS